MLLAHLAGPPLRSVAHSQLKVEDAKRCHGKCVTMILDPLQVRPIQNTLQLEHLIFNHYSYQMFKWEQATETDAEQICWAATRSCWTDLGETF